MDAELVKASQDLATSVGGALVAKPLLERLLGPSFEYVGSAMCALLERYGNVNLANVFRRAAEKADADKARHARVDPRVLRTVIEDASFADDEVTREYYSGLLASALSSGGEDDRAITFLISIRSLSRAQILLHFLIYSWLRSFYRIRWDYDDRVSFDRAGLTLFVADKELFIHKLIASEIGKGHLFAGLAREQLIGSHDLLVEEVLRGEGRLRGSRVTSSSLGAQLFLWVHGRTDLGPEAVLNPSVILRDWQPQNRRWVAGAQELQQKAATVARLRRAAALTDDLKAWSEEHRQKLRSELHELMQREAGFFPPDTAGDIQEALAKENWADVDALRLRNRIQATVRYLDTGNPSR